MHNSFMPDQKFSVSNALILLCIFFTALTYIPGLYIYQFGMNDSFYSQGNYFMWGIQFFTSNFLHWWVMHLVMNAIFILYFWNILEWIMWSWKYLLFFILNAVFVWVLITFFSSANTVWISGFALAVITYYTLHLYSIKNPEYSGWLTAIVVNIAIGLSPWISLLGHAWGMVFWWLYWFFIGRKRR